MKTLVAVPCMDMVQISPMLGFGEDIRFCWRVKQLGVPMYCDSRIKVGHVGLCTITEEIYQNTRGSSDA